MQDFKESVANVVRRALWRRYPTKLITAVWARFLYKRWTYGDIRKKELLQWFKRMLGYVINQNRKEPLDYRQPQPSVRLQQPTSEFLQVFGRNPATVELARREPSEALTELLDRNFNPPAPAPVPVGRWEPDPYDVIEAELDAIHQAPVDAAQPIEEDPHEPVAAELIPSPEAQAPVDIGEQQDV